METHLYVSFDGDERPTFAAVASASILGGPETSSRTTIVQRAAAGEPLDWRAVENLKAALEGAVADREANVEEARNVGETGLAEAFATWLGPLGEAWGLACNAESVLLGGAHYG